MRTDGVGAVTEVGILLRATPLGEMTRTIVSGRVRYGETVRDALFRHLENDLGPMAFPLLPPQPVPFTVAEYFPIPGVSAFHDDRQHAVSLAFVVPVTGTCEPRQDALEVTWMPPAEAASDALAAEMEGGRGHASSAWRWRAWARCADRARRALSVLCDLRRDAATGVALPHELRPPRHRARASRGRRRDRPLAVGAAILAPMAASGAVDLPDKTAEELLEFAAASDVDALSGTIEQTSELGLPDLEALGMGRTDASDGTTAPQAADIDDLIALATGTHTANVYLDGRSARLQVLDQLAERNVYVDGEAREAWFVDSETLTATRLMLPSDAELEQLKAEAGETTPDAEDALTDPRQPARRRAGALDETTEVTVGTDARVAGREVYELILAAPHGRHARRRDPVRDRRRERRRARRIGHRARRGRPRLRGRLLAGDFEAPDPPSSRSRPAETSGSPTRSSRCRAREEWAQHRCSGRPGCRRPCRLSARAGRRWSSSRVRRPARDVLTELDPDELGDARARHHPRRRRASAADLARERADHRRRPHPRRCRDGHRGSSRQQRPDVDGPAVTSRPRGRPCHRDRRR